MNRPIKVLLIIFIICLMAVVANLSWIQIFGAEGIEENAFNKRRLVEEYAIQRGDILSADRQVIARSVDTGTEYQYQREYPLGPLFADVTGYDSWRYGRSGLEKTYNKELLGSGSALTLRSLANKLLGASKKGDSLVLTVDSRLQATATEALAGRKGAVVALDPKTGAVLAMVTAPTYNPNVTVPFQSDGTAAWDALVADPNQPLLDRCTSGLYPPGSSFKVVVAAAALDSGVVDPETPYNCTGELLVHGFTIHDFGGKSHGNITFADALVVSCNNTFAQTGLSLGAPSLVQYAELFGFNEIIPFNLPVALSRIQEAESMDPVALASSSVGQAEVLATPLEMAMVAAAVANGGVVMEPYLVEEIQDYNGKIIEQFGPHKWQEATDRATASTLTRMMVEVVEKGTGTAARIPGVEVAGKTGTAEVKGVESHAWFICFAPALDPEVAVAVIIENGGEGGKAAAPVAREVLQKALSLD
ncbi:MAG: hypothetical protein KKE56_04345 [Actinobacteria bacterium]|nr:hypothetical protein [Actinomycetota bacterium]